MHDLIIYPKNVRILSLLTILFQFTKTKTLETLRTKSPNIAYTKSTIQLIYIAKEATELNFRASFACIGDLKNFLIGSEFFTAVVMKFPCGGPLEYFHLTPWSH